MSVRREFIGMEYITNVHRGQKDANVSCRKLRDTMRRMLEEHAYEMHRVFDRDIIFKDDCADEYIAITKLCAKQNVPFEYIPLKIKPNAESHIQTHIWGNRHKLTVKDVDFTDTPWISPK